MVTRPPARRFPGAAARALPALLLTAIASVGLSLADDSDLARVALDLSRDQVLVGEPFSVTLTIELAALPGRHAAIPPLLPNDPPHIESPVLDMIPAPGLDGPDLRAWLESNLLSRGRRTGFTINRYTQQQDSFSRLFNFGFSGLRDDNRAVFQLPNESRLQRDGRTWWRYHMSFEFTGKLEGHYRFGPLSISGPVVAAVDAAGNASPRTVALRAEPLWLRVVPPPADGRPASFIGSVGRNMRVSAELDRQFSRMGEPLQLTLEITGDLSLENLVPPQLNRQANLAERFRAQDDSVVTTRLSNGKRFEYRLRPLQAGTQELPPIEAAYFDLNAQAYRIRHTDPIPLQIAEASRIEISLAGPLAGQTDPNGQTLRLRDSARMPAGITLVAPTTATSPEQSLWAWLAAPLAFVALYIGQIIGSHFNRRQSRNHHRRAADALTRQLSAGIGSDDLHAALGRYLVDGWQLPPGHFTPVDVVRHLRNQGLSAELAAAWGEALTALDANRYHPSTPAPRGPQSLTETIQTLLTRSTDFSIPSHQAIITAGSRWVRSSRLLMIGLMLLGPLPVLSSSPGDLFRQRQALSRLISAETPEDFHAAALLLGEQAQSVQSDAALFYNLGTALLLAGDAENAWSVLRRAERWGGNLPGLRRNLRLAHAARAGLPDAPLPWHRWPLHLHYALGLPVRQKLLWGFWTLGWGGLIGSRRAAWREGGRTFAVVALILSLLVGLSFGASWIAEQHDRRAWPESLQALQAHASFPHPYR